METRSDITVFINKERSVKTRISPKKTLLELRKELEKIIPNYITFVNKGKIINSKEEKNINILDIIDNNNNNSINITQRNFIIYIDNKAIKIEAKLFKNNSLKELVNNYPKIFPKIFNVKCEDNLLIVINSSSIDESIKIKDILIEDAIYVFSITDNISSNSNIIYEKDIKDIIIKCNGHISFDLIESKNIPIFYSSILDNKYDIFLNQCNYEIRKMVSMKEYDFYKLSSSNDKNFLKKIIQKNNTNPCVIFDYLILLKNSKDATFEEELKKYGFLLDINQLKKIHEKFNQLQVFKGYYDEKKNFLNFLQKVINGKYSQYYDIGLIISHIDFRNTIQEIINSPFINSFNKDHYINIPISITDNNLFFHYLRVKFFQFLQYAFGNSKKKFEKYCKMLYDKIIKMTEEKNTQMKSKLLLEILCMVVIYGFHSNELYKCDHLIDYYNNSLKNGEDNYYYPMIFFSRIKNILFDYFRMISNSNTVKTSLEEYKKIINYKAQKEAILDIKQSIDYLLRNTVFVPFFSNENWGFTIPAFNLSFVNIDIFEFQEKDNYYPDYAFLFCFVKYLITMIHEPIGHNLKIYESFNSNLETPFDTPRIKKYNKEIFYKGGFLMEMILLNSVEYLNIEHVLFLLNEKMWELDHETFLQKFKKINTPNLANCISLMETGIMDQKLFSIFKINQKSIENAIKSEMKLPTKYKEGYNKELGILSTEGKYRTTKDNIKRYPLRVCHTHLFY